MTDQTHAQILSDIAAKVAASHRNVECRHCGRDIVRGNKDEYEWVDPEATGDDSIWRETCDAHDTFMAEHEPTVITEYWPDDAPTHHKSWDYVLPKEYQG
jgi:hypothetical protein